MRLTLILFIAAITSCVTTYKPKEPSIVRLLDSIVSIFKKIPDSHVILETIQPKKLYTGDRTREAV